jgi:hypothetical protein
MKNTTKKIATRKSTRIVVDLDAEQRACDEKANYLLGYMDLPTVDFITDALIDAIADAGEITGFPTPTFAPEENDAERRRMLADLFSQAYRVNLRDSKFKVLRATLELLHNPETPQDLHEAIAEFVCNVSNKENIFHSKPVVSQILASFPPEELRGAIVEAREVNHAEN